MSGGEEDVEVEHSDRCCMEGAWPGWGPHPDCPGVVALDEAYAAARRAVR